MQEGGGRFPSQPLDAKDNVPPLPPPTSSNLQLPSPPHAWSGTPGSLQSCDGFVSDRAYTPNENTSLQAVQAAQKSMN